MMSGERAEQIEERHHERKSVALNRKAKELYEGKAGCEGGRDHGPRFVWAPGKGGGYVQRCGGCDLLTGFEVTLTEMFGVETRVKELTAQIEEETRAQGSGTLVLSTTRVKECGCTESERLPTEAEIEAGAVSDVVISESKYCGKCPTVTEWRPRTVGASQTSDSQPAALEEVARAMLRSLPDPLDEAKHGFYVMVPTAKLIQMREALP